MRSIQRVLPFRFCGWGRVSNCYPFNFRSFSADSHDDFKPKLKNVDGDAENTVIAVIKKQVAENPVMLYMKVFIICRYLFFSTQSLIFE